MTETNNAEVGFELGDLPHDNFDDEREREAEALPLKTERITTERQVVRDELEGTTPTTLINENRDGLLKTTDPSGETIEGPVSFRTRLCNRLCGKERPINVAAYFLLGLFNNITYVVNNAGAGDIVPGDIGLIYITGIVPTLIVKITGPYWFHYVPYNVRIILSAVCISLNFILVMYGKFTWLRLVGVALGSIQGGLGESTLLGSAALYDDTKVCLGMWSSGTGFAGPGGYILRLYVMNYIPNWGRVIVGQVIVLAFLISYFCILKPPPQGWPTKLSRNEDKFGTMTIRERFRQTLKLMVYIFPLFLVYFAEYSIQAGAWTGYSFDPSKVDDPQARNEAYEYLNFLYQWGVFISRSSTALFVITRFVLWLMPAAQCLLLIFFCFNATLQFWNGWSLLVPAFITGLFGGFVYANAFALISKEVQEEYVEFSLTTASVGDSLGILVGDIVSMYIQACIFQSLGIADQADETCPGY